MYVFSILLDMLLSLLLWHKITILPFYFILNSVDDLKLPKTHSWCYVIPDCFFVFFLNTSVNIYLFTDLLALVFVAISKEGI